MAKIALKGKMFHLPYPTTLVGAKDKGKPNYLAIGYCGIKRVNIESGPPPHGAVGYYSVTA